MGGKSKKSKKDKRDRSEVEMKLILNPNRQVRKKKQLTSLLLRKEQKKEVLEEYLDLHLLKIDLLHHQKESHQQEILRNRVKSMKKMMLRGCNNLRKKLQTYETN